MDGWLGGYQRTGYTLQLNYYFTIVTGTNAVWTNVDWTNLSVTDLPQMDLTLKSF